MYAIYSDGKKFRNDEVFQRIAFFWENVKYRSFRIFPWLSNGDTEFDLDYNFEGHFKVKFTFLNGNRYFLLRIWKEREILRQNMTLIITLKSTSRPFQDESSKSPGTARISRRNCGKMFNTKVS